MVELPSEIRCASHARTHTHTQGRSVYRCVATYFFFFISPPLSFTLSSLFPPSIIVSYYHFPVCLFDECFFFFGYLSFDEVSRLIRHSWACRAVTVSKEEA
jgi:hypothetical protein